MLQITSLQFHLAAEMVSTEDEHDLSGVTSVQSLLSQSPFSTCEDEERPGYILQGICADVDDDTTGIKTPNEVANLLTLAEYGIGEVFKRERASTISYSSSTYNDIQQGSCGRLQQCIYEIGDDELVAANFLSSLNQMKTDGWADCGEPSPMYLIRTVEKFPVSDSGLAGTYTGRVRPRSHSVSDISPNKSHSDKVGARASDGFSLGSYTPEERRRRIERFLEKRKLRVWTKRVKYDVRKNFADSRVRVRGRFVKKDASDEATADMT